MIIISAFRPKKRKRPMASAASVAMIMPPTTAVTETMRLDWIAVAKLSCFTARAKLSNVREDGHRVWSYDRISWLGRSELTISQ